MERRCFAKIIQKHRKGFILKENPLVGNHNLTQTKNPPIGGFFYFQIFLIFSTLFSATIFIAILRYIVSVRLAHSFSSSLRRCSRRYSRYALISVSILILSFPRPLPFLWSRLPSRACRKRTRPRRFR